MSSAVRICLHDLFLLAASSVPMVNRSVTNTRNEGRHHAHIWSHPGCHLQQEYACMICIYSLSPQFLWSMGRLPVLGMMDSTMPYMESSRMSSAVRIRLHDLYILAVSSVPMVNRSVTSTRNDGQPHADL